MSVAGQNAMAKGLFKDLTIGEFLVTNYSSGRIHGVRTKNDEGVLLEIDVVAGRNEKGFPIIQSQLSNSELAGPIVETEYAESHPVVQEMYAKLDGVAAAKATLSAELVGNPAGLAALATLINAGF